MSPLHGPPAQRRDDDRPNAAAPRAWPTSLDTRRVPAVIDRGMAPFSAITHREAHGADWAQAVDFTLVVTLRCVFPPSRPPCGGAD